MSLSHTASLFRAQLPKLQLGLTLSPNLMSIRPHQSTRDTLPLFNALGAVAVVCCAANGCGYRSLPAIETAKMCFMRINCCIKNAFGTNSAKFCHISVENELCTSSCSRIVIGVSIPSISFFNLDFIVWLAALRHSDQLQ